MSEVNTDLTDLARVLRAVLIATETGRISCSAAFCNRLRATLIAVTELTDPGPHASSRNSASP
ncbi:MAG TPA: hypothetical protein VFN75_05045 [Pseudonocardiaceae bacterium]|nr:hypothetical protein [Pseudonocardiaceae bacterium]